jgi:hypothetical protein
MGDKEEKKKNTGTERRPAGKQLPIPRLTPSQLRRLMEKPATKARRLAREKERMKVKKAEETPEEGENSRVAAATRQRLKKEEEDDAERAARRASDVAGHRAKREEEGDAERAARRASDVAGHRAKREEEDDLERATRRAADAAHKRAKREAETPEEKKARQAADSKYKREQRAAADPAAAERRRQTDRNRTTPTVRMGATTCMRRHGGPCGEDRAGHYPFYMVSDFELLTFSQPGFYLLSHHPFPDPRPFTFSVFPSSIPRAPLPPWSSIC